MRKAFLVLSATLFLVAATLSASAMQKGTFDYGGYTITVVPFDPSHPGHGGDITITCATDAAIVNLSGQYTTTSRPAPRLSIYLAGTIETPDCVYEVERTWVLVPRDTHNVWRIVVSWIDSMIAS